MPYTFKIINSGNSGVGKTTYLYRLQTGTFLEESKETIGSGFFALTIWVENETARERLDLTIWDLGGQERFRHIIESFIQGAAGALLFFDITRYDTFEDLPEWIDMLRGKNDKEDRSDIPILLIGNKADLEDIRAVQSEEAEEFARENGLIGYMETSCKTGQNVHEAIRFLAEFIYYKNKGIY